MVPNDSHDTLPVDDPRLTAYALGELEAHEVPAVEALLAQSAEARDEVAAIRELAGVLATELAAEPAPGPGLADEHKRAIEDALAKPKRSGMILRPLVLTAAAAALLISLVLWSEQEAEDERASGPAMTTVADAGKSDSPFTYDLFGGGSPPAEAPLDGVALLKLRTLGYLDGDEVDSALGLSVRRNDLKAPGRPIPETVVSGQVVSAFPELSVVMEQLSELGASSSAKFSASNRLTGRGRSQKGAGGAGNVVMGGMAGAKNVEQEWYFANGMFAYPLPSLSEEQLGELVALGYITAEDAESEADDRPRRQAPTLIYQKVWPVPGTEGYEPIVEQGFQTPFSAPLSTFSIDVDTASYANVRRFLQEGRLPPIDAVRIEELINYFDYDYSLPDGDVPFAVELAVTESPWNRQHRLVRIGLKGREIPVAERAPSNLVFLVDVSGSMSRANKLPLLIASLKMLVGELDARDRVALVTYAGSAGLVLDSTPCTEKSKILAALDNLRAGGSTHGSQGIQLAYETAVEHFIEGGTNRVILATDGDFNVGITDRDSLHRLIEDSAKSNVFLSVLLFGTGNIKDNTAELLADKGNGNYSYIDSFSEARKVLVSEMGGTLITIAKDVKIQVEFNPAKVGAYRLIGYENRALAARDFNDDKKDAGEIGAGHTVTAIYEIVPRGVGGVPGIDPLKYQQTVDPLDKVELIESDELLTVALRYKEPEGDVSTRIAFPLTDEDGTLEQAGGEMAFATAVATYGMLLRHSDLAGDAGWDMVLELAERGRGEDPNGYRAEFIQLVHLARGLSGQ